MKKILMIDMPLGKYISNIGISTILNPSFILQSKDASTFMRNIYNTPKDIIALIMIFVD